MTVLETTQRTRVTRAPKRASYETKRIYAIIDEALIGHLAFQTQSDIHSIPMPFWRDENDLYCHCSTQSRLADLAKNKTPVCISFTILDGLVLAKSVAKTRQGPPKKSDLSREVWSGVIPCLHILGEPES